MIQTYLIDRWIETIGLRKISFLMCLLLVSSPRPMGSGTSLHLSANILWSKETSWLGFLTQTHPFAAALSSLPSKPYYQDCWKRNTSTEAGHVCQWCLFLLCTFLPLCTSISGCPWEKDTGGPFLWCRTDFFFFSYNGSHNLKELHFTVCLQPRMTLVKLWKEDVLRRTTISPCACFKWQF